MDATERQSEVFEQIGLDGLTLMRAVSLSGYGLRMICTIGLSEALS